MTPPQHLSEMDLYPEADYKPILQTRIELSKKPKMPKFASWTWLVRYYYLHNIQLRLQLLIGPLFSMYGTPGLWEPCLSTK